jgi:predicted hotdog family 3-hydroxylacyl-ACP dehydratase
MIAFPAIAEVLPHSAPMILLDEIVACGGPSIRCRTTIRSDSMFLAAGRVRAIVSLEYMAQAAAAFAGMRGRTIGAPPGIGYVIGAREMTLAVDQFEIGDGLLVDAEEVWREERMSSFRCRVIRDGRCVAEASLNFYLGALGDPSA